MAIRLGLCLLALAASGAAGAQSVEISEWLVPWERTRPATPFVDDGGRVWFVGERGDYVANLSPVAGSFSRYDLPPGSGPRSLLIGADGVAWYAAGQGRYLGRLDPATGRVTRIDLSDGRARDPFALAFDGSGNVWFTAERGNVVGRLAVDSLDVSLVELPARGLRPAGIVVNSRGEPWVAASDDNRLLRIDPDAMTAAAIELPERKARPARLALTSDDNVWWTDVERGYLGRLDPQSGRIAEWPLPGGEDSEPLAIAADRLDRLWVVESGSSPGRVVGFDAATGRFFSQTDIPSGGEGISHLHYYEPAGEIWFATDANYIGRASIQQ